MIAALRSEFRKLLSIRSAYFLALIVAALIAFIVFISAYQTVSDGEAITSLFLADNFSSTVLLAGQLSAIFAALFMSHEYRYNLIFHTLTTLRSRALAIVAKMVTISAYSLVLTAIVVVVTVAAAYLGADMAGGEIPSQNIPVLSLLGRSIFYVLGFSLAGLLFAVWFRNVVMPVALLILLPNTVEPLASMLLGLGEKANYLPFTALQQVMLMEGDADPWTVVLVFSLYLVVGWLSGWVLFSRRDAMA